MAEGMELQTLARILVIDDDESGRGVMELLLRKAGFEVRTAANGAEGRTLIRNGVFDLALVDLLLPDCNGIDILKDIREVAPQAQVVMITGHASAESAVMAMKAGAFDYITKPINFEELKLVLGKARETQRLLSENVYLRRQLRERFLFDSIIGSSPAMRRVFERMQRIVKTDSTVLITGESGTGKELVASALHHNSRRKDRPFIAVNCGAIPESLMESELFGHVRGAFTGAVRDRIGKFEAANHGTIFLDEIGTMPLHLQSKLLRVLQEQEIERVGSTRGIKLDVRVISATNADLDEQVRLGGFREDLYYRLNVIPLHLPPLRERREDILPLVSHFLEKFRCLMGRQAIALSKQALDALERYQWPGNVRQLENVVERMVALADDDNISLEDLPAEILEQVEAPRGICFELTPGGIDMPAAIEELERQLIARALELGGGVKARAAALLGVNRTTLVEKLKRLRSAEQR
ncbi:sigma-54-dependent transcriptional regulator [Trichlorobacter ammonificans]|uniref:Regulatory protein AtoC n=1 Tax=Trichlorobacter ammonificans TaxID=2916410 RepID=A0ABN8HD78_9BACT|nr:sigma-54 dependent transcriptional regulator [Trichlorobacter ammonificans]CAH2030636.1 Regulatory protein AtoC [Trichlorobacter ammonificans]